VGPASAGHGWLSRTLNARVLLLELAGTIRRTPMDMRAVSQDEIPTLVRTHMVRTGENLTRIAQKCHGKASLYTRIFEANRDSSAIPTTLAKEWC
jgi:nucleoid-associated protein YgaU